MCHSNQSLSSFLAFYFSSGFRTYTTQQALELMFYYSAMLLMGQLKSLLYGRSPKQEIITFIAIHEALNFRDLLPKDFSSFLLPNEIEFPWQNSLEGLRILASFCSGRSSDLGFYLPFALVGILYCFSEYLGIQQMVISMIGGKDWAGDAERELGPYRPYGLDVAASGPRTLAAQDPSGDRTSVAKRLFINSSWS